MIGSGNVSSYGTHTHEHTVTRCLHETHDRKPQSGGSGPGAAAAKSAEGQRENVSLQELLSGGWEGFVSKSFGLLGKIWKDGETAVRKSDGRENAAGAAVGYGTEGIAAEKTVQLSEISAAAEVLAAASVRKQVEGQGSVAGAGKRTVPNIEDISGGMADGTKDAADGRTWKEQAEIRKLFQQFGKTAARIRRTWKGREEAEKEDEGSAERNSVDVVLGDSSYLLDSYNRSGEYSTLAENRSLEGKFRAMG